MSFTTVPFFIFLVVVFSCYWCMRSGTWQNVVLTIASYVFYSFWDWRFAGLMFVSSMVDYVGSIGIADSKSQHRKKWILGICLGIQLAILGFFKYYNFFVSSFEQLVHSLGWNGGSHTLSIILPVGISFYTFQTMSYTIDVYRGKLAPIRNVLHYVTFVSFFPQLLAGPIERAVHLLPQFLVKRKFEYEQAKSGVRQILWGLVKKMVLADNLALIVDQAYNHVSTTTGAWLIFGTVCFAFQIYCDFSGYSDIAIGLGRLFGIELMQNFAYPYFSRSVPEFWRRWHISLSSWFRDYLFIPLGGSRNGKTLWIRNIMITFVISGLWHGASWNFVIWGGLNGLAMIPFILRPGHVRSPASEIPGGTTRLPSMATLTGIAATFGFICLTWVFFRANSFQDAMTILGRFATEGWRYSGGMRWFAN